MISKLLHVHMHARTHVHKSTFTLIVIDWKEFKCLTKKINVIKISQNDCVYFFRDNDY